MSKTETKTAEDTIQGGAGNDSVSSTNTDVAQRTTGSEVETYDFGDDAGKGMENVGRDEFIVPMFRILQANSPQCKPVSAGGLPGAKAGDIMNTATNELIDGQEGFPFIPVHRDHNFIEFTPRNLGGGFVGARDADDPVVLKLRAQQGQFGKLYTSDKKTNEGLPAEGTEIAETYYLYGLDVRDFVTRGMIGFNSTQIKKYRGLISRVDSIKYVGKDNQPIKPPLWAHRWRVTTVFEFNKKGEFYGWAIRLDAIDDEGKELAPLHALVKRSDPLYQAGKDFYELIQGGGAKADYAQAADAAAEATEGEIPM